jgi:hypothetical protein
MACQENLWTNITVTQQAVSPFIRRFAGENK